MNKELLYSFNVLRAVYIDDAYSSIELNKLLQNSAMEKVNTQLITKIVYGVLEKDIYLSYVLSLFCKKKPDEISELLLKMGVYILQNINSIPTYTCVNEIVEICKKYNSKFVCGFINATLKKISITKIELPKENNIKYLSVKYSYPEWIVKKLMEEYGEEFVEKMLSYSLTTLTHIRINDRKTTIDEFKSLLKSKSINYEESPLDNCLFVDYSELNKSKEFSMYYAVQGIPSIVVCNNFPKNAKVDVLDLCSAPGGKSVLIASNNPEGRIISCDIYENRLKLVKEYADRYGIKNIGYKVNDACEINEKWIGKFDYVLCDVPCSNLGVVNKKPDVLLRKTNNNIRDLSKIQEDILNTASLYLKKGGVLIYSTCTIMKEENQNILKNFLDKHINFEAVDINTCGIDVLKNGKFCTFIPHVSKCEGFFIGGIKRRWQYY